MSSQDILLLEYTEIMLGNKQHFSDDTFGGKKTNSEQIAADFMRMISKVYLQCESAAQAKALFTDDLIARMHLTGIIREIKVPDYIDNNDRRDYMMARIFTKNFDPEKWAAERYCNRVINGSLFKFPRNYMDGEIGIRRACFCLRYFLKMEKPNSSALDLLYFSASPDFRLWLQKHLLLNVCTRYFDSRVDFMFDALPEEMKIDIFYMLCKSKIMLDRASPVIRQGEVVSV